MGKLEGKVAIVTGGGRGIGLGAATAMAREGASIAIVEIDSESASRAAEAIAQLGVKAIAISCDVGSRAACESAVAQTVERLGAVDVLVNNATQTKPDVSLVDHTDEEMEVTWRINVMATFWLMQASHPHMIARGGGSIINFGSSAGTAGLAGFAAYACAKEGIRGLTRVAAREWGADRIRVNVVCPFANSPGVQGWAASDEERFASVVAGIPLRRVGDCEDDIGRVVAFLASDDSSYVTAQTMMVDGGSGSYR
jgi:NAD(P)-dependent dehydrogenase (short-subunit alcohol dehydrogenase family)